MLIITNIAILLNTSAGNGRSVSIAIWLSKQLKKKAFSFQLFDTSWPSDFSSFSDIWIIGGDGTLNYFINHYPDCRLPLAIFKGGTGNDFAWKLYGNLSKEVQLERILSANPRPVDAGICNDKLFINCIGIGFDGEILQEMSTIRYLGGHIGYLLAVLKKILFFREYSLNIQIADEAWREPFLLAVVNNSSRVGGGFFTAPHAMIDDGKLNMVLCQKLPVWKRLRYLPVIEKGKHLHLPFIIHRTVEHFTMNTALEIPLQVDGELLFASKVNVSILPGRFLFRY